MRLDHEGLMIGVQYQLMICRGHIRASKGTFQIFFVVDGSMAKLIFSFNFALWSSFQVEFERVVNGLGGQKSSQGSILIWSNGIQCKNRKIFYQRLTGVKKMYFFGSKT